MLATVAAESPPVSGANSLRVSHSTASTRNAKAFASQQEAWNNAESEPA